MWKELDELGFTTRTTNAIINNHIYTPDELYEAWVDDKVTHFTGVGSCALEEINAWAVQYKGADEKNPKIVQIAPVIEYTEIGSADHDNWRRIPNRDATVYGLSASSKLYYWATTKRTRVEHTTEEQLAEHEYEKYHYEYEYGWKECGTL